MHINDQNNYINKIGKCYLRSMDVSYGGDKFVTYNADEKVRHLRRRPLL